MKIMLQDWQKRIKAGDQITFKFDHEGDLLSPDSDKGEETNLLCLAADSDVNVGNRGVRGGRGTYMIPPDLQSKIGWGLNTSHTTNPMYLPNKGWYLYGQDAVKKVSREIGDIVTVKNIQVPIIGRVFGTVNNIYLYAITNGDYVFGNYASSISSAREGLSCYAFFEGEVTLRVIHNKDREFQEGISDDTKFIYVRESDITSPLGQEVTIPAKPMQCRNRYCGEFFPWADKPNCPNDVFMCYSCRTNPMTYQRVMMEVTESSSK